MNKAMCPVCNGMLDICPDCGGFIPQCPHCGNIIEDDTLVVGNGTSFRSPLMQDSERTYTKSLFCQSGGIPYKQWRV
jgi:hypothetical protein